jgi:hypothetical protein
MTTNQHTIQWPTWTELADIFGKNPNRVITLSDTTLSETAAATAAAQLIIQPPGQESDWIEYQLDPPGHLSAIMYCRDPFFADAPTGLRSQMIIDATIEVNQDIDEKIRTTAWARYRKKALEWLSSKNNAEESANLWEILCTIYDYQSIIIDSVDAGGEISFAPADIRTWTTDKPLIIVNKRLSHLWTCTRWSGPEILSWLIKRDSDVKWPKADGTKTELIAKWELNPAYIDTDRKKLKEQLAELVGRSDAITHLQGLNGGSGLKLRH